MSQDSTKKSPSGFLDKALGSNIGSKFLGNVTKAAGFNKAARSINLNGSQSKKSNSSGTASWKNTIENPDWRVKISVPVQFPTTGLLEPMADTGALVFPYTPTIIISHSANYNALQPVHTNYPYQVYDNSSVQEIVITGDFTVENDRDGRYWVAAIHYLRSVTKMFYGSGTHSGAPPPLVKLNGYGDYVFNDVPCVVTNFTVDLPADVDYIAVPIVGEEIQENTAAKVDTAAGVTWVPSTSLITVTVQPTYSRKAVSEFSLNDFVNGNYVTNGKGFI